MRLLKRIQAARVKTVDVRRALSVEKPEESGATSDDSAQAHVLPPYDDAAKEFEDTKFMHLINDP